MSHQNKILELDLLLFSMDDVLGFLPEPFEEDTDGLFLCYLAYGSTAKESCTLNSEVLFFWYPLGRLLMRPLPLCEEVLFGASKCSADIKMKLLRDLTFSIGGRGAGRN